MDIGVDEVHRSDCGAGYYYSWYSVEPERAGWCRSDCGAGYYYSWYSVEPERAGWCRSDRRFRNRSPAQGGQKHPRVRAKITTTVNELDPAGPGCAFVRCRSSSPTRHSRVASPAAPAMSPSTRGRPDHLPHPDPRPVSRSRLGHQVNGARGDVNLGETPPSGRPTRSWPPASGRRCHDPYARYRGSAGGRGVHPAFIQANLGTVFDLAG